jgi:predicted RNase H-like HicB family nuclease
MNSRSKTFVFAMQVLHEIHELRKIMLVYPSILDIASRMAVGSKRVEVALGFLIKNRYLLKGGRRREIAWAYGEEPLRDIRIDANIKAINIALMHNPHRHYYTCLTSEDATNGGFLARCPEFDLASTAETEDDAKYLLDQAVKSFVTGLDEKEMSSKLLCSATVSVRRVEID